MVAWSAAWLKALPAEGENYQRLRKTVREAMHGRTYWKRGAEGEEEEEWEGKQQELYRRERIEQLHVAEGECVSVCSGASSEAGDGVRGGEVPQHRRVLVRLSGQRVVEIWGQAGRC